MSPAWIHRLPACILSFLDHRMLPFERWAKFQRGQPIYESLDDIPEDDASELDLKHCQESYPDQQEYPRNAARTKLPLVYTILGLSAVTIVLLLPLIWTTKNITRTGHKLVPERS